MQSALEHSREQTPLLQPHCTHASVHTCRRSRGREESRSRSAEQLEKTVAMPADVQRTDSDGMDSGFSTFPRSVTLASVGQWSNESPRFRRLPKDVPNDSGSFSIVGYDTQEASKQCRCVKLPVSSTRSCSAISGIMKT
ncbi:uncharacterized protein LOC129221529 [Uloborus diversus]|uniref:uncharacterized protein LOC129221529 n=1 Tax=Uloborus diversus TaxID=327109 RepID=UPI00240A112C|nr:uncharacterized protein LOC129221529 [Uloborus diversus]